MLIIGELEPMEKESDENKNGPESHHPTTAMVNTVSVLASWLFPLHMYFWSV